MTQCQRSPYPHGNGTSLLCRTAIIAAASAVALTATVAAATATTSPVYQQAAPVTTWHGGRMRQARWFIKANDYAEFPYLYGHWAWMGCGQTAVYGGEGGGPSSPEAGPCEPGQTRIFANENDLAYYLNHSARGQWVMLDDETWSWTPAWQNQHAALVAKRACLTAHRRGDKVIATFVMPQTAAGMRLLAAADQAGGRWCDMVNGQLQRYDRTPSALAPRTFLAALRQFLRVMRGHRSQLMVGLATDEGGLATTPQALAADYREAYAAGIRDFWLNAAAWLPPRGDGTGDAIVGEQFLHLIGAAPAA